jgi:DNA polymerase
MGWTYCPTVASSYILARYDGGVFITGQCQNMPAGRGGKQPTLRRGLIAPPGHVVITGDLAQIEARLVAWLAGCDQLLAEFAKPGGDPYSAFASLIFGFQVDKKLNPIHRFIGKTGVLGLGYQAGVDKFYNMVITLARLMGINLEDTVAWDFTLAQKTVSTYRTRYWQIKALWWKLQTATAGVWGTPRAFMKIGPVTITYGNIEGPNGLSMKYYNPRYQDPGEWVYQYGWGTYKMYGGKMLENIIQFLARIIIMNAALRLNDLGYRFVLQSHDELVYIVPQSDEDNAKAIIYRELIRRPSWGRDIPLNAEVNSASNYGDAK